MRQNLPLHRDGVCPDAVVYRITGDERHVVDVAHFEAGEQDTSNMATQGKARFRVLLDGYSATQLSSERDLSRVAKRLFTGLEAVHEQRRKLQATAAADFNLLETLQIAGEEIRHSMLLAWLLRRDETHAQGNLGFRLFLKEFGLDSGYASEPYWVIREKCGEESRVDVEVATRGKFIIHIENKIYSDEGENQTTREWKDLQRRARALGVRQANVHGLYLTLDGHAPIFPEFRVISWKQIANVLDDFAEKAKAKQVSLFAAHYADALRRMTFELTQEYEEENEMRPESDSGSKISF